jgi:hypothetical protein
MTFRLANGLSGRDHYAELYTRDIEGEANYLAAGALGKVDSVQRLLRRVGVRPKTLMELGAGTGAVISACRARGLAGRYVAVDYAASAVCYMQSQGLEAIQADITDPAAQLPAADVVVLTHVLEHLEQPEEFLHAIRQRVAAWVIVEVPLEDLPLCRVKAMVRDRRKNTAGHVQFFTSATFERLIRGAGFEIVARHRYIPIPTLEMLRGFVARDGLPSWYLPIFWLTRIAGPRLLGSLASRLLYAHYAVICRPSNCSDRSQLPASD